ncbi:MAG TPA: MATE family efflux transporter [Xanthobacteraceae bacterium]|nr:MATE family efflux transporter [Xanthobacteraceae bacterium]
MSNGSVLITQSITAKSAAKPGSARTRLLLEGPIIATLLRLAAPNVVVNVVLIAVTATVDAHFVGRMGSDALAGLSLVFPLIMLMQQMANSSMGGAIASAIARAIGAGRHDDASALVVHGVIICAGMAVIFAAVLLVGGPGLFRLMGGTGTTHAAALEYSNAIFAGAFAYWLLSTLTSAVRGAGQAIVLAVVYIAAEALHIILVPVFMFGIGPVPPLGITGAGIATVASFTASSAILAWYIASGRTAIRPTLRGIRLDRRLFVEILRVGAPMSLQPILNNLALALLTGFVGALGAAQLAGFGVAVRLEYLLYPLAFGLGAGVLAMVGTNIGAGKTARAARIAWTAAALAAGITGCIGLFGATLPDIWTSLFTNAADIHVLTAGYLLITGGAYPFLGLGLTLASSFQAAGRPLWPIVSIASRAVIVAVGGWTVVHLTSAGLGGLAVIAAAGLIVYGAGLAIAFRAGLWQRPAALTPTVVTKS